jgi:hypothetical protein
LGYLERSCQCWPPAGKGALDFPHDDHQARKSFGPGLVEAVRAARSARFEHGTGGRAAIGFVTGGAHAMEAAQGSMTN